MGKAFHYQNTFDDDLAREFRNVLSVGGLALFDPFDWWDFTDKNSLTLTGGLVDEVANKGTNNDPIIHNSGNQISFDGTKGIGHQYANNYSVGEAGARNFLHDGSGCEIFVIHKQALATNEQYFITSNNIAGSSYAPGLRFSSTQNGGLATYTSRVGYDGNHFFSQSVDNTLSIGTPIISHISIYNDDSINSSVEIREDGLLLYYVPYIVNDLFNQADHDDGLRVFLSYTGDIYGMLIYNRRLDSASRNQVFANLRRYYGLPSMADVSLLLGSSNIDGVGSSSFIPETYQAIVPRSYIYAYEDGEQSKNLDWWPYEQDHSHVTHASTSGSLDLSLMHRLSESNAAKQFLIKVGIGGAEMYSDFNPDADIGDQDGLNALMEYLDAGIERLQALGFTIHYRGCIIGLGENDTSNETKALAYEAIQSALNAALRQMTVADLPIIITGCSTEGLDDISGRSDGNMAHQPFIRTAQQNVADAEEHSYFYQPIASGILAWNEVSPNGVHYDMPSMIKMGIELADMLNDIADDLSDIEGLQLLLDGTDSSAFTLDGGRIAEWRFADMVGKAIQNNASYRPTVSTDLLNGLSGVFFDYSNLEYMVSDYTPAVTDSITAIALVKRGPGADPYQGDGSVYKVIASSGRPDGSTAEIGKFTISDHRDDGDLTVISHQIAAYGTSGGFMNDGDAHIITGRLNYEEAALLARADGVDGELDDREAIEAANEVLPFEIGGSTSSSSRRFGGTIYQLRIYSRALSDEDISRIEKKLAIRFGLYHPDRDYAPYGVPEQIAIHHGKLVDNDILTSANTLALWLDASDFSSVTLEAANKVSQWRDKSPHSNDADQTASALQPVYQAAGLNGKAALQFYADSVTSMLLVADDPSMDYSELSIMAVIRWLDNAETTEVIFGKYETTGDQREFNGNITTNTLRISSSPDGTLASLANTASSNVVPVDDPVIIEMHFDGSTITARSQSDEANKGNTATSLFNGTSAFKIGAVASGVQPFAGYVAELVFYTHTLSETDEAALYQYLASKWEIT